MALAVSIRTENGTVEAMSAPAGASRLVILGRTQGLPFLSGIDFHEDTWFNSRQMPYLLDELSLLEMNGDVEAMEAAEEIRHLAGVASKQALRYLVFVGA